MLAELGGEGEINDGFEHKGVEHFGKKALGIEHDVALLEEACPDTEELLGHELVAFVVLQLV